MIKGTKKAVFLAVILIVLLSIAQEMTYAVSNY